MSAAGESAPVLAGALERLARGLDLGEEETFSAVAEIMTGAAGEVRTAALLMALRVKGETELEIAGAARALRQHMTPVAAPGGVVMDTCGTGGDGLQTFNISTATAFVVAGAGVRVAKHGNRSVSSRCGSADVLEALGIPMLADAGLLAAGLRDPGLAFLFAPFLHPAMKNAAAARRQLHVRTVLNLVGPLANPAGVQYQLVGVPDASLTPMVARVLGRLGARCAWVVCGEGGMDELTTTGPNQVAAWDGGLRQFTVDAVDHGLPRASVDDLRGGGARDNAARILGVLQAGKGPDRDIVLLNSAAALVVAGAAEDLDEGLRGAAASIDSGAARGILDHLRAGSGSPA